MTTLRTPKTAKRYLEYLQNAAKNAGCSLCEKKSFKCFKYWKVAENSFPYDQIATIHHLLLPIRHVSEAELSSEELAEFRTIRARFVNAAYDYVIESTERNRSIRNHYHLYLIVGKS